MPGDLGTEENPVLLDFSFIGGADPAPGRQATAALKLPVGGNMVIGLGLVAVAIFLVTR